MTSLLLNRTFRRWLRKSKFGALLSLEKPEMVLPLRDNKGVNYQIAVTSHFGGLRPKIFTAQYEGNPLHPSIRKEKVVESSLLFLRRDLDRALVTIRSWMDAHGAVEISERRGV